MQSGKPCPRIRCSDIAKELEKEFPELEPQEIQKRVGERLKEIESKRKELELRNLPFARWLTVCRKEECFSDLVDRSFSNYLAACEEEEDLGMINEWGGYYFCL